MDREIPKEVRNKERNKKIIRYSSIGVAGIVVILYLSCGQEWKRRIWYFLQLIRE